MLPSLASLTSVIYDQNHQMGKKENQAPQTDPGSPQSQSTRKNGKNSISTSSHSNGKHDSTEKRENGETKFKVRNLKKISGLLHFNQNSTSPKTADFRSSAEEIKPKIRFRTFERPATVFEDDFTNSTAPFIPAVYLPARPRKSKRSTEFLKRATLAEPEQSISDFSSIGTIPPSPPVPPQSHFLSNNHKIDRGDSFVSAIDIPIQEKKSIQSNLEIKIGLKGHEAENGTSGIKLEPESSKIPDRVEKGTLTKFESTEPSNNFYTRFSRDLWRRFNFPVLSDGSDETGTMDPMKWAFYNVSAFTMAVCSVLGILAAYFLFYEFVKPAMWALICGIVLFPLKRRMSGVVKGWLDELSENGKPLTFAIVALPLDTANRLGELLLDTTTNNLKMVLLIVASFPASALLLHFETIPRLLVTAKRFLLFVDNLVSLFSGKWVPFLLLAYLSYICISNLINLFRNKYLCHICTSWAIWCAGAAYGCNYFGPFRTPLFLALLIICCTYFVPFVNAVVSTKKAINRLSRRSTKRVSRRRATTRESGSGPEVDQSREGMAVGPDVVVEGENDAGSNESNTYLKRLFIACFFVYISLHLWMVIVLILPIGIAIAHRIAVKFDVFTLIQNQWRALKSKLGGDTALLFPTPFLHVFRVLLHIDSQVIYYLRQSMDLVGSLTAMIVLLVAVASVVGFVIFQLYYESMHLINLTGDIANQTLTKNPGLQKWLRHNVQVDSVADLANEAVQRMYSMSRGWLSSQMQEIVQDDPEKAKLLESQIVNTFDAFFHNWLISRNATDSTALAQASGHKTAIAQWADVWTAIGESGADLDWNVFDNLNEYISLLLSVADSAWMIVKNNMEILMLGFSQIASTLLASGTAVVDFFLDSIVFLTFLLYLLSESDDEYKPLKLVRDLLPGGQETASKVTEQVEQAVNGVFLATSKMAIFYGMFTWLTHTLFAVNLVFIPSVLAAAFAAVPFFGTYLVALPAILELWLIRGEPFLAILLFVIHYIPSYVVDDAIYSDIKLTTPLLSGMAIAGGILWWGLEGAIFGPLVLCGILVLGGVYKSVVVKTMTSETSSRTGSIDEQERSGITETDGKINGDSVQMRL